MAKNEAALIRKFNEKMDGGQQRMLRRIGRRLPPPLAPPMCRLYCRNLTKADRIVLRFSYGKWGPVRVCKAAVDQIYKKGPTADWRPAVLSFRGPI